MINTENLDSTSYSIFYIIITIIVIITILIFIDELYYLTRYSYYYTYYYNYGKLNEKMCKKDNNNLIEYDTARYKIYSILSKYKLEKDIFNRNWINFLIYTAFLFFTILICISFAYIFHNLFIQRNNSCVIDINSKENYSYLNMFLTCTGTKPENLLPNCTLNYFVLFIILVIYPLILFAKFSFKRDYTWKAGYYSKIFHFIFLLLILYYIFVLFNINDPNDYYNIKKLSIYTVFVIIFYISLDFYNKKFDEYNNTNKATNIYKNSNDNKINFLNKYFNLNYDESDYNDELFFDIYSQKEPKKPDKISEPKIYTSTNPLNTITEINNLNTSKTTKQTDLNTAISNYNKNPSIINKQALEEKQNEFNIANADYIKKLNESFIEKFKYCSVEDFNNPKDNYCKQFILETNRYIYTEHKKIADDYHKNKNKNEYNLNNYNIKNNIYKNSKYVFAKDKVVSLYDELIPKFLGFDKYFNYYILLIIFVIFYYIIHNNDMKPYDTYIFNTIIIYLIAILSLGVLENGILTFNTYFNKYLIYEPTVFYKENLNNLNILFTALISLNSDSSPSDITTTYIKFYNAINKKDIINSDNFKKTDTSINLYTINKRELTYYTSTLPTPPADERSYFNRLSCYIFYCIFHKLFYFNNISSSDIYKHLSTHVGTYKIYLNDFNSYITTNNYIFSISVDEIETNNKLTNEIKTFFIIIKNIFIENLNDIDNKLNEMLNKFIYLIYEDNYLFTAASSTTFYSTYLKEDITDINIDYTKKTDIITLYKNNITNINFIFKELFKKFLINFRINIINLLNVADIKCDTADAYIDISSKLNKLISKITDQTKFDYSNIDAFYTIKPILRVNGSTQIRLYKKLIINTYNKIDIDYKLTINKIKEVISELIANNNNKNNIKSQIEKEIINNYNYYNKESKKHTDENLINDNIKQINYEGFLNTYNKYTTNNILELNLNINNVCWSFVIIIIIFAIILIEPIIISA